MSGFSSYVVSSKGNLAQVYVPQFNSCGTAWLVDTSESGRSLDCVFEFDAISNCTTAAEVATYTTSDAVQGLQIKGNFITDTTNGLIRTGTAAFDDGMVFDVLAMDITEEKAGGAVFDNQISGHTVARLNGTVRSWLGGDGFELATGSSQLFKGQWSSANIDFTNAIAFTDLSITPDLVRGSTVKMRGDVPLASAIDATALDSASSFNGGRMITRDTFLLKVTVPTDVAAGGSFARAFYHGFGDSNYPRFSAFKRSGGNGIMVESINDYTATVPGQVAIIFRNCGSTTVTAGTEMYVKVVRH